MMHILKFTRSETSVYRWVSEWAPKGRGKTNSAEKYTHLLRYLVLVLEKNYLRRWVVLEEMHLKIFNEKSIQLFFFRNYLFCCCFWEEWVRTALSYLFASISQFFSCGSFHTQFYFLLHAHIMITLISCTILWRNYHAHSSSELQQDICE